MSDQEVKDEGFNLLEVLLFQQPGNPCFLQTGKAPANQMSETVNKRLLFEVIVDYSFKQSLLMVLLKIGGKIGSLDPVDQFFGQPVEKFLIILFKIVK